MPAGNFAFNIAKRHLFAATASPPRFWDGVPVNDLGDYRLVLVTSGGATNGLNAAGAEDFVLVSQSAIQSYLFQGSGWNINGIGHPLPGRAVSIDTTTNRTRLKVDAQVIANLGPATAPSPLSITDLVLIWTRNGGSGPANMSSSLLIARWDVSGTPVTPDGRDLQINWPSDGALYL